MKLVAAHGTKAPADLSILIVNWNSAHHLKHCLTSIYNSSTKLKFEVIVVDNGSFDGSAEVIPAEFPQVKFIQSGENLGFAKANNLAYRHSSGDILLFLNPDTEVIGDALWAMYSCLHSTSAAGAIGCLLLNSDRSIQTSCVQAFPTIWNQVLDADFLRRLFPCSALWGSPCLVRGERGPVPVDSISGACLMVKRAAFEAVGLFNEDFFMYAEDVELCYRLNQAGFACYHFNGSRVVHHGGRSSAAQPRSSFSAVLQKQSLSHFLAQSRGTGYARAYRAVLGLAAALRVGLLAALLPAALLTGKVGNASAALSKWYHIFRWSVGRETWATDRPSPGTQSSSAVLE